MDLFSSLDDVKDARSQPNTPLAARMRPHTLDQIFGQSQILGPKALLRRAIEQDALTSVIFYGPPGVGKSTLAMVIAGITKAHFEAFSAVTGGVPELRKVIEAAAQRRRLYSKKTILFVDEIHRFNKSQQDALLPHVENGTVSLIGATTENPYFEVNAPLLSRARVFTFERLSNEDIAKLLERAAADVENGLGKLNVEIQPDAMAHIVDRSEGDARTALNALEAAAIIAQPEKTDGAHKRVVTKELAEEALQQRALLYDKTGDRHYDTISAFIKSLRGSDPDAALHYLAKMLTAGEDPRFIARRLIVLASEDVGNADPMGIVVANAAAHAVEFVGMPEARINLAQAVTYLASAPKSNASYVGLSKAMKDVETQQSRPIPKYLRDSRSTTGRKQYGETGSAPDYLYPHDYPRNYVEQQYMPDGIQTQPYYEPTENGEEKRIKAHLESLKSVDEDVE